MKHLPSRAARRASRRDALSEQVYSEAAYRGHGARRLLNRDDGIFRQSDGSAPLARVARSAAGLDGAVVLALL